MTIEAVRAIGGPVGKDLLEMALAFWEGEQITWKQQQGVIKLLPKEGDKELIKNWSPIYLLNLGYKIIAKLMANRLKEILPKLVDRQQKGFVQGRSITDNVMAYKAGLVQGATAKLHVGGSFSREIPLERGVRQGCPLAPLLFAIATQPLMLILKKAEEDGKIHGLKLKGNTSLLQTLFADDSVKEEDQRDFILAKIKKKLGNWQYKLLSFAGRVTAVKHILRSTPVHIIACLSLQKQTLDEMEAAYRRFLWGDNNDGNPKVPMIAWSQVQKPKGQGGLGLDAFRLTSRATRLRQVAKLLLDPNEEWVQAAELTVRTVNNRGREARCRDTWTVQDLMLLAPPKRIPGAPTVTGLLEAWNMARKSLRVQELVRLNKETPVLQYIFLAESQDWITTDEAIE
ncbi:hypothetical protein R1sor_007006 [Riccia sorocarpa]|uniref:Reverse transcriptase domain-containing protein n=1 Tax=Riccia sorocarpa TaxID=122646 RepID=A0ABD3HSV9_9MARC